MSEGNILHQRPIQPAALGIGTFHRRGQLLVVAGKDDAVCLPDGYPAGSLQRLRRLVDEKRGKAMGRQEAIGGADKRRCDDPCLVEEGSINAYLQLRRPLAEAGKAIAEGITFGAAAVSHRRLRLADGFPDAPQFRVVGMRFEAAFVGKGKHLVVYAGGIADSEDVDAPIDQLFGYPIHSGVALGADEDLIFTMEGLEDGLDKRRRLPRARGTVDNAHFFGP